MDDSDEFKKLIKSYFDDTTKQIMQGFELMASQLRGKLEARSSSSFHHWETHKKIIFEEFYDWLHWFIHNKEYFNSLNNNQQSTSMEETKESPSYVGGEVEKVLHQEDRNSLPSDLEKMRKHHMRMNKMLENRTIEQ